VDLLAELAGIRIGSSDGGPDETEARWIAELCAAAGADESKMPAWIAEGQEAGRGSDGGALHRRLPPALISPA
jgi:hypothetical protein